jgi:hypothetical protein
MERSALRGCRRVDRSKALFFNRDEGIALKSKGIKL